MNKASEHIAPPQSLLLLGPPGSGKSTLVSQFSNVFILDCDNNLGGPIRWLKNHNKPLDFYYDTPYFDSDGNKLARDKQFARACQLLNEAGADQNIKTIALDSLTTFIEMAMAAVLKADNKKIVELSDLKTAKISDDQMEIKHWGHFYNVMKNFIFELKSCGKTFVLIAHVHDMEDGSLRVAIPGKTANMLPGWFSEVWMLESSTTRDASGVTQHRKVLTFPPNKATALLGLKSSVGVESESELDAEKLIAQLNA